MSDILSYFGGWKAQALSCDCGWRGAGDDADSDPFAELLELSCPGCHRKLALVPYPTADEVRAAAIAGHAEAVKMLVSVEESERRQAQRDSEALRDVSDLPDIPGDGPIEFIWDLFAQEGEPDKYYAIYVAGKGNENGEDEQFIWSSLAGFQDWERFEPVKALLKERYGARFKSLTVTREAEIYLIGDSYSARLEPG